MQAISFADHLQKLGPRDTASPYLLLAPRTIAQVKRERRDAEARRLASRHMRAPYGWEFA